MKAMAHALLSPDPTPPELSGAMKGKALPKGKTLPGVEFERYAQKLISQARAVRKYAPTLVEKVRGFLAGLLRSRRAWLHRGAPTRSRTCHR